MNNSSNSSSIEVKIQGIIKKIPVGKYFDSHFVIDQLVRHHFNDYLNFASTIDVKLSYKKSATVNKAIALIIKKQRKLVEKFPEDSSKREFWSVNVSGKPSACTGWIRKI